MRGVPLRRLRRGRAVPAPFRGVGRAGASLRTTRVSLETRSTLARRPKLPFKAATCHFRLIVRTKCATHSLTLDHTRSSAPSRASHLWRTRNSPHSLRFGESQPSVQRSRHTRPAFARRGDLFRGHTRHTRCRAGKKPWHFSRTRNSPHSLRSQARPMGCRSAVATLARLHVRGER